ncbi:hypothetical protein H6F93_28670 [Leptolyngbya sp. FACHB-671]|uniref:hypothetical protein n=1 Tax=Leptolyngbya sp. FACHB-671 TaxID=2692812 RepID=UPI001686D415|nr:hypothetical protein [Leptolyngbya sp. FACHB-671]MBD2071442.1 hypothetical protein [Leptolyngbya sp. FACHB-671]
MKQCRGVAFRQKLYCRAELPNAAPLKIWALLIWAMNCVGAFRETPLQVGSMPVDHTRIQQHQNLLLPIFRFLQ